MFKKILLSLLLLFSFSLVSGFFFSSDDDEESYKKLREQMVSEQIEQRLVKDSSVLESMKKVKRHLFVPQDLRKYAYEDRPLPIGYGQTISQPYIVALMTELLKLEKKSKVLEVGTGSGYQAAVLSEIIEDVYTIEIIQKLYERAAEKLKDAGYKNVKIKNGDGYYGWKEYSPYDAIIVTAASEFVPPPLIQQLKVGGRMVIPVGPPFYVQQLVLITKKSDKNIETEIITDVKFVPLTGKAEEK